MVHFLGVIWIRISDPRSVGSWCIKGTNESTLVKDSSVPLMHHDPSDLGERNVPLLFITGGDVARHGTNFDQPLSDDQLLFTVLS